MSFVGLNVGALTVKVVVLRGDARFARVVPHQGRALAVVHDLLATPELADAAFFAVSGQLGHVSEAAAIQRALQELPGEFDALASLGGESFLVYMLSGRRIVNVLSHNKCAAGSGEFFVQQISRMGLSLDDAIQRSFGGKVVPLASRCSVHCKSDVTHKLNRNEATAEDILHTLHDSMADKVTALLEKGQKKLGRVLLTGGVTRNAAMLAALREKLPGVELVVIPESPWLEAWGTALIARDDPRHRTPSLSSQPSLGRLPPLSDYRGRVTVIAAPPRRGAPDGPVVLGVDAGSTTTKATLIDPVARAVVASHYTRTQGDPVAATRECLEALRAQVGDLPIGLVATTGSARELVGAYLGAVHVYNEISAQAAGAAYFDPAVDTIFEIGGQDAKYIYLRNGVPVDYAMNNACSAGTGSFLEESAQGDLGIAVSEIAGVALGAPSPVHFKATCAAFINSDIRVALQQGHSRDDIAAGLVYAIADNYVSRVKGPRPIGKRVFLQGGVALNAAVGHAFAHRVGRDVVIPPSPELLGALGVGLLALERASAARTAEPPPVTSLSALAAPEMKVGARFTCKACTLYCSIDRFEVAGRRFPFGGRCSLFESVWKRQARVVPAPDLVERRADVLFGDARRRTASESAPPGARRIGVPRALSTHSLYPLYATFFSRLGYAVVLSGIDARGELRENSAFCYPVQIAHGAVMDLARQGVGLVFLPHVMRMPRPEGGGESYLCPISQAEPYYLTKAFPEVRFLSPLLDLADGYERSAALADMAVSELGIRRDAAEAAWADAIRAQLDAERALRDLGRDALTRATAAGRPVVVLAGHSYNAFTPEASQSVGKKLASMGVTAIPADCLAPGGAGSTAWHFANQIMGAVQVVNDHPNLFLLCVSNFSCTVDAFTQSMIASAMGSKPYLILEIDAHTADGGVQTRLEAFLDILHSYRAPQAASPSRFTPCKLTLGGVVHRSNGETVPLADPRVRLYFPNFSSYHARAFGAGARWLGLSEGPFAELERAQLDLGLQNTSGRECLPLPLVAGQLLRIHAERRPGEIVGLHMVRGGAPCVLDAYSAYLERFIVEHRLPDLFVFDPLAGDGTFGIDDMTIARHLSASVLVADILVEIEEVLAVVGASGSVARLRAEWERFIAATTSLAQFDAELPAFVARIAALPRTRDPRECPRVVVTGEFFTRFSHFFMEGVHELYGRRGIILKPVDLDEMLLYMAYQPMAGTALDWGMKPGGWALAKACTRVFSPDGRRYLQQWATYQFEQRAEARYRGVFQATGLLVADTNDVVSLFEKATPHVSLKIYGEALTMVGKGLQAGGEGYDGVILIGPFNCLPFRVSEAILKPLSIRDSMPFLSYESDGYSVAPSFLRQVDVHIQQVLDRFDRRRGGIHASSNAVMRAATLA